MRLREGVEVRPTLIDETFAVRARIRLGAALGSGQREALSLRLGDDRLHRLMRGSGLH